MDEKPDFRLLRRYIRDAGRELVSCCVNFKSHESDKRDVLSGLVFVCRRILVSVNVVCSVDIVRDQYREDCLRMLRNIDGLCLSLRRNFVGCSLVNRYMAEECSYYEGDRTFVSGFMNELVPEFHRRLKCVMDDNLSLDSIITA